MTNEVLGLYHQRVAIELSSLVILAATVIAVPLFVVVVVSALAEFLFRIQEKQKTTCKL